MLNYFRGELCLSFDVKKIRSNVMRKTLIQVFIYYLITLPFLNNLNNKIIKFENFIEYKLLLHKNCKKTVILTIRPRYTGCPIKIRPYYSNLAGSQDRNVSNLKTSLHCKEFHCKNYRNSLCPFSHCSFNAFNVYSQSLQYR